MLDVDERDLRDEAETAVAELESERAAKVQRERLAGPEPAQRGNLALNLASNVAAFAVTVLISFWYTRYLICHLGVAAYGIVPLALQLTNYLAVVMVTLNAAVGRYVTIALEQGDEAAAVRYFNTSVFGTFALALAVAPAAFFVALHPAWLINIPQGLEKETAEVFVATVAVFLLGAVVTPFGVSSYSMNRFDLRNIVTVAEQVTKAAVVVVLFHLFTPQIPLVGVALAAAGVVSAVGTIALWRRLTPRLRLSAARVSWDALKKIASTGGWMAVNHVGTILFLAIDLIVVNRMLGPTATGHYAPLLSLSWLLRNIATVIVGVFGPTMAYLYARDDIDGLVRYCRRAIKFMGILIALPIGLICGLSKPLLATWLKLPEFVELAPLLSLMTIHLAVNLAVMPIFILQPTVNRVRTPGIVAIVAGCLNLGLAITLAGPAGWGMYGVAAAGAIALTAKNLLFTPLHGAKILNRRWDALLWEVLPITLFALGVAAVSKATSLAWDVSGLPRLIAAGAAVSVVSGAAGYWLLLNHEERAAAWNLVVGFGSSRRNSTPENDKP